VVIVSMSQRARSPVLGYNHNLRHGGRVFHVQTEDSGQGYARLYTHLFYQGTILSSKKQEYDPASPEDVVRAAMQKLHKLMIMELTHAEHDPRIAAFFAARGEPATLPDPAPVAAAEAPQASPAGAAAAVTVTAAGHLPAPAPAHAATAPPAPAVAAPAPAAPPAPAAASPAAPPAAVAPAPAAPAARPKATPKPVVVVQPAAARRPSVVLSNPADGVVVRRNVVIDVGAGQPPVHGTIGGMPPPAAWPARARAGSPYAVRDGSSYVAGNRARALAPEAQPQPLASVRDIRMPWETPGPTRIAPSVPGVASSTQSSQAADAGSTLTSSGKLRMPWDAAPSAAPEAFSNELVSDKSLDEVILEYLADDGETEER
jgi:hypothetical protein